MKILVTGANGYLGQGVVKALLDNGHSVVAADFKTNYVDAGCFADVQTATARDLFDVASSGSLDKFDGSLVNKRRISVWANTWSRFSPCWVSGSLLSTITMTAIIIKVQRWEWMWSSVIW